MGRWVPTRHWKRKPCKAKFAFLEVFPGYSFDTRKAHGSFHVFPQQALRLPVEEERAQLLLELGAYSFRKPTDESEEAMEVADMAGGDDGFEEVDYGGGSSSEEAALPRDPQPLKRHRFRQKEAPHKFIPGTHWAVVPTLIED